MKVVIDNNIVVDALAPNPEFEANALRILQLASTDKINGCVCANSLTDIFYGKTHGEKYAKEKIKGLMSFTDTIPLTEIDCTNALDLPMSDFEDAIVAICAEKVGADYIVSRDEKFIKSVTAGVPVIKPDELLAMVK
ncbi:PIN domain-containing protein [Clostridia bacterium]|nr:PIN domain-containing protein [Clostridia bacterium]